MAKYFKYFPKTYYTLENNAKSVDVVTNLVSRFTFNEAFKNNTAVYYDYRIKDGETPENIANKLYGSSEKHWIILNFNNIMHPQFDWPLSTRTFTQFLNKKYADRANSQIGQTGTNWANDTVYAYYLTIKQYDEKLKQKITENVIEIDASVYANTQTYVTNTYTLEDGSVIRIDAEKSIKTYYQYEEETNEKKRLIKILKPDFVNDVEREFRERIT